jgi:hypothetical protein
MPVTPEVAESNNLSRTEGSQMGDDVAAPYEKAIEESAKGGQQCR